MASDGFHTPHSIVNSTVAPPPATTDPHHLAKERADFYATYDVMTGVRIAATLGGFFGLMVLLVLYKSKSKTERALEDPDFTAAAVAEAEEEEERQLAAVIEATAYQQLNTRNKTRRSLDTASIPAGWSRNAARFSSIGGYSALMEPPLRLQSRLPCCVDEDSPPEEAKSHYDDVYYNEYLDVPRRPSNITCSSSGSSYLERRDSSVAAGLPPIPGHKPPKHHHVRQPQSPLLEAYDMYYPIDIKVIQPTPGGSPCGSDRALHNQDGAAASANDLGSAAAQEGATAAAVNLKPRLAPLASISSCNSSLGADFTDFDVVSYDSLMFQGRDTDDEVDPFSTDSDPTQSGNTSNAMCYSATSATIKHIPHEEQVKETNF